MNRALAAALVLALPIAASAQVLTMPPMPVTPGPGFFVPVFNDLPNGFSYYDSPFAMLDVSGELVHPETSISSDVPTTMSPGQTKSSWFSIPVAAQIPPGSYVFIYPHPLDAGAATRVDVVSADPLFPSIHTFPPFPQAGYGSHTLDPSGPFTDHWKIANTSSAAHTFAVGDELRIFTPGGTTALVTVSLAGLTVPPEKIVPISLPLATLGAGVYTVETAWIDPAVGPVVRRTGVRHYDGSANLVLPAGKVVPTGGSLPARLMAIGTPAPPVYMLLGSVGPGSIQLQNGVELPLSVDSVFIASVTSGLFGVLQNHAGALGFGPYPCGGCVAYPYASTDLAVVHPNVPVASGITIRIAGVVYEPVAGTWQATQGEEVRFE